MPQQRFPAVDRIVRHADAIAAGEPDLVSDLAQAARRTIDGGGDPYLTIGVLVEAIAYAFVQQIPRAKQPDAAMAVLKMLMERLDANGT